MPFVERSYKHSFLKKYKKTVSVLVLHNNNNDVNFSCLSYRNEPFHLFKKIFILIVLYHGSPTEAVG